MFDHLIPKIPKNSKVVIGLGDSFTQGVGSWYKDTYKKYNGWIDPLQIPKELVDEMYENSWVHQLCRNHLPDFIPVNLGVMGTGNRAAVKELYLNPNIEIDNASEVIVVLMLSGMERFDFINREFASQCHFYTMWPNPWDPNTTNKKLWEAYANDIWSEKFTVIETILNICEAEMFCRAKGWKFVVTSAFDQRINKEYFTEHGTPANSKLVNSVPWNNFLYPRGMKSFIELLLTYDGRPEMALGEFYVYYSKLKEPTEYITNCMHPTQEGYRIIAEEIYKFLIEKEFVNA
jgi:hypothetical protein